MIDMAPVIAGVLDADSTVVASVFSDEMPPSPPEPFVLVRSMDVTDVTEPADAYQRYEMQVDIVSSHLDYGGAALVAGAVRTALNNLSGVVSGAVIAGVVIPQMTRTVDDEVSPARPRWVLAVEVTARGT